MNLVQKFKLDFSWYNVKFKSELDTFAHDEQIGLQCTSIGWLMVSLQQP